MSPHDRSERTEAARLAVAAHDEPSTVAALALPAAARLDSDPAAAIGELVANLRHLADEESIDWGDVTRIADDHYTNERK